MVDRTDLSSSLEAAVRQSDKVPMFDVDGTSCAVESAHQAGACLTPYLQMVAHLNPVEDAAVLVKDTA